MKLHPSDPDIETIVARIRNKDLDLQPDFQRGEVWSNSKKRRLIDSILRDWHVPPIHVVVDPTGRQVVLDGQQRLASIRDFVNGDFPVDGTVEPYDESIAELNGLKYDDLPDDRRRAFNQFTIRVFRLTDYSPEEPGELFFRLNQMTYLTAAEQRNAFFGPVRQQIKSLVGLLDEYGWSELIGFSNRRMAYDDVVAKLLCTFEVGTLAKKITATDISSRFRGSAAFEDRQFKKAIGSIELLNEMLRGVNDTPRFNKATLFSWLIFLSNFTELTGSTRAGEFRSEHISHLREFCQLFERRRGTVVDGVVIGDLGDSSSISAEDELTLLRVYMRDEIQQIGDEWPLVFLPASDAVEGLFRALGRARPDMLAEKLGRECDVVQAALAYLAGMDDHDWFEELARTLGITYEQLMLAYFEAWYGFEENKKLAADFLTGLLACLPIEQQAWCG